MDDADFSKRELSWQSYLAAQRAKQARISPKISFEDGFASGVKCERDRIRRELLAEMPAQPAEYLGSKDYTQGWNAAARVADEVVRRVLSEEPSDG